MKRRYFLLFLILPALLTTASAARAEGLFHEPALLALDDFVPSVAVGDVTGDGLNDVILGTGFCDADCGVLVLSQTSFGGLSAPVRYPAPGGRSLIVGDLNDDGRNDVLTADVKLGFLYQDPAGHLRPAVEEPGFRATQAATAGDLDRDGRLDVVTLPFPAAAPAPLVVDLHYQRPGGGFTVRSIVTPWEWSDFLTVEIADLDGDGRLDLFVNQHERLLVLYQQPRGGFVPSVIGGSKAGISLFGVTVGNFDRDPLPEIAMSGRFHDPRRLPAYPLFRFDQTAPRRWTMAPPVALELPTSLVQAGDLDGNGRDDLVMIPFAPLGVRELHVLLQNESGGFDLVDRFELPFGNYDTPQALAIGDLNHDMLPDLAVADDNFGLLTFIQKGSSQAPPAPELFSPAFPDFGFTVRISSSSTTPAIAGALEPRCIPETVCVSGAIPGRSEVFLRVIGPKPNGKLWPTLVKFSTSQVDVWVHQISTGKARHYRLAGASRGQDELAGLFDRAGFEPSTWSGQPSFSAASASVPPPPEDVFTSPAYPDFRFRARITSGDTPRGVRQEAECIEETVCLSGAVPGRSELFLRIVGPRPNGRLWPTIVKFTTSTVEVWMEQVSTGESRYYRIEGAAPGKTDLTGLFDRGGFPR